VAGLFAAHSGEDARSSGLRKLTGKVDEANISHGVGVMGMPATDIFVRTQIDFVLGGWFMNATSCQIAPSEQTSLEPLIHPPFEA
jgi:hypothetical protein